MAENQNIGQISTVSEDEIGVAALSASLIRLQVRGESALLNAAECEKLVALLQQALRLQEYRTFNLETADAQALALYCVYSAAFQKGQDPLRFWGIEEYPKVLAGTLGYIEKIGLEQAKALFRKGELNFPSSVYD